MRSFLASAAVIALSTAMSAYAAPRPAGQMTQATINHDFSRLSDDGQKAFVDIYAALQAITDNKGEMAEKLVGEAHQLLARAAKDEHRFVKAESVLTPAPGVPTSPGHRPMTQQAAWVPVIGIYTTTETLAPEKQSALSAANLNAAARDNAKAAQNLQVVGMDLDYTIGLAPIAKSTADVYRASIFLGGGDMTSARDALQQALDSVVFISDDTLSSLASAPPAAPMSKNDTSGGKNAS